MHGPLSINILGGLKHVLLLLSLYLLYCQTNTPILSDHHFLIILEHLLRANMFSLNTTELPTCLKKQANCALLAHIHAKP